VSADAYAVAAMGTPAPAPVIDLVARFSRDREVFLSGDYKEEQLRAEFLNPSSPFADTTCH